MMENMKEQLTGAAADRLANTVLHYFAFEFSNVKKNRRYLKTRDGWNNFSIGLTTEDGAVAQSIWFKDGKAKVKSSIDGVDTLLTLQDTGVLAQLATLPPNEVLNLMLRNKMSSTGNMSNLEFFNLLISVLMKNKQIKQMQAQKEERAETGKAMVDDPEAAKRERPAKEYLRAASVDPGVKYLTEDPYLSTYTLDDYPRLKKFLDTHLTAKPAVCVERAQLLTNFFRQKGFETKEDGTPGFPKSGRGWLFVIL